MSRLFDTCRIVITGERSGIDPWEVVKNFHDFPDRLVFTGYIEIDGKRLHDMPFTALVRGVMWGDFADTEVPREEDGLTLWAYLDIEGLRADMVEVRLRPTTGTGSVELDEFNAPRVWFPS